MEIKKEKRYILLSYDVMMIVLGFEEYKEEAEVKYLGHEDSLYIFENIKDVKEQYKLTQEQVEERIISTKMRPKDYEITKTTKKK